MKLDILGKDIPVKRKKDLLQDGAYGEYDSEKMLITLDNTLKGQEYKQVLLHEAVHALLDRIHIQIPDGLEEVLCDTIATMVTENFNLTVKRKKN